MSAQVSTQPEGSGGAVESYRAALRRAEAAEPHRLPGYDELVGAEGVHPEDELLADTIDALGPGGMRAKAAEAARYVSSDGITYGATADGAQARNWHIDPLPTIVGADEWTALERGLEQRARLLDLILRDVYGPRRLLRRGVLPPEIVLGHPGFVRQSDGIALPTAQQLILAATDVARSADGGWVVFGDRTQAPSGAGYAMATRRIVARTLPAVHRRTSTARLRGFFHTVRAALLDSATTNTEAPRVVVLSPGAGSETAYDQAFLATLLGFPLVEGDDLAMRDGRVWMRTPGADQRVDVILRRVDADFADPLELRSGSQLGVPGLIDAARRGQVSIVNPMGAGVLENPCLLHFLGPVSRELLGEDLLLPQPDSWWCGDDTDRQHVLANLDRLVIKPLSRDATTSTRFGWLLSAAERDELAARVEATPWAWAAQEPLPESTAPVVTGNGIEPRRLVLRTFGVAHDDRYAFLPGALGRVAGEAEQDVVSNTAGALAKDVWVLAGRDSAPDWSERESAAEPAAPALAAGTLAPRMADDLHWFGRYAERVEATARILSVVDDLTEDYAARPGSLGAIAMQSIQHAVTMTTGIAPQQRTDAGLDYDAPDRWATDPEAHLRLLVGEESTPGTLAYAVARLVQCAQRVRDQLSLHTWPVLARLEQTLARAGDPNTSRRDTLEAVLESSLALAGIVQQSMIRDATWAYVDAGVRVERAALTVELVRATLAIERSPVIEGQIVEAVLQVGESVITHRRRTSAGEGPSVPVQSALHLLLVDRANPRSLAFQLDRFSEDLRLVDDPQGVAAGAAIAMDLPELDVEALGASDRSALDRLLVDLRRRVDALANALASQHFRRKGPQGTQLTEWTFAQHQSQRQRQSQTQGVARG